MTPAVNGAVDAVDERLEEALSADRDPPEEEEEALDEEER